MKDYPELQKKAHSLIDGAETLYAHDSSNGGVAIRRLYIEDGDVFYKDAYDQSFGAWCEIDVSAIHQQAVGVLADECGLDTSDLWSRIENDELEDDLQRRLSEIEEEIITSRVQDWLDAGFWLDQLNMAELI